MTAMPFTSWGKSMLAGDFPSSRKNTHRSACWRSDHPAGAAVRGYRGMVAVHAGHCARPVCVPGHHMRHPRHSFVQTVWLPAR